MLFDLQEKKKLKFWSGNSVEAEEYVVMRMAKSLIAIKKTGILSDPFKRKEKKDKNK